MKRIQSILFASLLTVALSSNAFAGNIHGVAISGNIHGVANTGNIHGVANTGNIHGVASFLLGLLTSVI